MQELAKVEKGKLAEVVANVIADKSDGTARKYTERLAHFAAWLRDYGQPLDKRAIGAYRRELAVEGKAASTINGHLVAVRALLREAAEMDLISYEQAERMASIKSVKQKGERLGNWLSREDAQRLLDTPDGGTLKGTRDKAILALLLFCGLRRSEITGLTMGHLQERDGHNVIADLLGKGGRVRTVKLPVPVKRAIDSWLEASGRELPDHAPVFVAMRKGGKLAGTERLSDQAIYKMVREYAELIGKPELRPHDLRRTFAKLARTGDAPLEQISLTLGHARLETTQRYLGTELNLDSSAPDFVGLRVNGKKD
ncbi:MAG: tyrosine-type recombinase/integrase [Chloroflexi bacterium]|nr:tyrosine-type recombinase/integrase [Chloroflexota bacterium]